MAYCQELLNPADTFDHQLIGNLAFLGKIATKYIKDEEDRKDLVQDTVYKAIKNKHKFKANSNLRGWLVTVLRNTFINQYHRNKHYQYSVGLEPASLEGETIQDPILNSIAQPLDADSSYRLRDSYNVAVKQLSIDLQILIIMCDVEGYTYEQISDFLDCPVGTVRSRLYRSRKSMVQSYRKMLRRGQI